MNSFFALLLIAGGTALLAWTSPVIRRYGLTTNNAEGIASWVFVLATAASLLFGLALLLGPIIS